MNAAKNLSLSRRLALTASTFGLIALAGCHNDMWIQPKVKPQDQSDVFPDQMATRPLPAHTLDRDHFWTDSERYTGYSNDLKIATTFPFKITAQDMARGKERFEIFCTPCHGALGNGQGMIAQRGFALRRQPGNYHTEKLLKEPVGHFYDVITNGYGAMYSYASRIEPDDRWRIVAYIKALQRSQNANLSDVDRSKLSEAERKQIDTPPPILPVSAPSSVPAPNNPTPTGAVPGSLAPGNSTPVGGTPAAPLSSGPQGAPGGPGNPPPGGDGPTGNSPNPGGSPPPGSTPGMGSSDTGHQPTSGAPRAAHRGSQWHK